MAYENLIHWYETKGYDFSNKDFLEAMKSEDDISETKKTLMDYADSVSGVSKKPFSKGQKEGLRKALDADEISGEFERDLRKRELQEQVRAEQYTAEVKRIKGLQQIAAAEEFETEYPDIKESIEIQNASKVKEMVKGEIVKGMAEAREREKLKQYEGAEAYLRGLTRESISRKAPRQLLKFNIPNEMWSTKEGTWEGKTYSEYETIAREVMQREGILS